MSEKLETKAVEILDGAAKQIEAISTALQDMAKQYGPEVIDAGLNVVRINGAQNVIQGVVAATAVVLLIRFSINRFALSTEIASAKDKRWEQNDEVPPFILGVFSCIGAIVSGIWALCTLPNIWNYIAIIEPKLWIARKIIGW